MFRLKETEVKILKILNEKYNENPLYSITTGDDLHLTDKLHVPRNQVNAALGYLDDKGLIKLLKCFGQDFYQDHCYITPDGIDALREIDSPSQQNSGAPSIINNGVMLNPIIGNDNSVSITIDELTIENSFNSLREHASSDESRKIISEMEEEAKSGAPSLDKLLAKGKALLREMGNDTKQLIISLLSALIVHCLEM